MDALIVLLSAVLEDRDEAWRQRDEIKDELVRARARIGTCTCGRIVLLPQTDKLQPETG